MLGTNIGKTQKMRPFLLRALPGMHIPAPPEGEDWSPLTAEQMEAARQAAR
jgi:hypothetical protein